MISANMKIRCAMTGALFVVTCVTQTHITYTNGKEFGLAQLAFIDELFEIAGGHMKN